MLLSTDLVLNSGVFQDTKHNSGEPLATVSTPDSAKGE
jgi:hypothetical protein